MQWVKIKDWPYLISDTGLVKSIRTGHTRDRSYVRVDGYLSITLLNNGHRKQFCIHRLVCAAFHGDPPSELHEAAHNNGNKLDNRDCNLRWATRAENIDDIVLHGTQRGISNGNCKLSEEDVLRIRYLCSAGIKQIIIAKCFGIEQPYVSAIHRRIMWCHLPPIDFDNKAA